VREPLPGYEKEREKGEIARPLIKSRFPADLLYASGFYAVNAG
jgi:hypothetical protein